MSKKKNSTPAYDCRLVWQEKDLKGPVAQSAFHYGVARVNGFPFTLCNYDGTTFWESGLKQENPCDLVRDDMIPVYRALGRTNFLQLENAGASAEELKSLIKRK